MADLYLCKFHWRLCSLLNMRCHGFLGLRKKGGDFLLSSKELYQFERLNTKVSYYYQVWNISYDSNKRDSYWISWAFAQWQVISVVLTWLLYFFKIIVVLSLISDISCLHISGMSGKLLFISYFQHCGGLDFVLSTHFRNTLLFQTSWFKMFFSKHTRESF